MEVKEKRVDHNLEGSVVVRPRNNNADVHLLWRQRPSPVSSFCAFLQRQHRRPLQEALESGSGLTDRGPSHSFCGLPASVFRRGGIQSSISKGTVYSIVVPAFASHPCADDMIERLVSAPNQRRERAFYTTKVSDLALSAIQTRTKQPQTKIIIKVKMH